MKDIWDILDTVVLEQVQNKDVYIYIYQEHFYESICVFLDALKSEVYINGFVSNERYDYRIFNKNIYKVEDVLSDNSIILCPNCEKIQNRIITETTISSRFLCDQTFHIGFSLDHSSIL